MRRVHAPEHLDQVGWDEAELTESLRLVAGASRALGGSRVLRRSLADLNRPVSLLDVGTGGGDLLSTMPRSIAEQSLRVGVDHHPEIARIAHRRSCGRPDISIIRADALALPFVDNGFDVVVSSLVLHHLRDADAVQALSEMGRVAKLLLLVLDLERSRIAWWGARALASTVWRRNRLTRVDGPLSVRRAYRRGELEALACRAGLDAPSVKRRFPFGLVLQAGPAEKSDGGRRPASAS